MTNANTQTIEINGVKLEVDMRYAKRIEELRVGDPVRVLEKNDYSGPKIHSGVIVSFEPFKDLPTIVVAYMEGDWNKADVKFASINSNTKNHAIVRADTDVSDLDKAAMVAKIEAQQRKLQNDIDELELKKKYFLANFKRYWEPVAKPEAAEVI